MLTVKEKSRAELQVVSCGSCCTEEIRCFGTGRIYIRPIQVDLSLDESGMERVEQYEDCLLCKMPVALTDMRQHMDTCGTVSEHKEQLKLILCKHCHWWCYALTSEKVKAPLTQTLIYNNFQDDNDDPPPMLGNRAPLSYNNR